MQDLINSAPYGNDPVYVEDNHTLYTLLRNLTQKGFAFTYVKDRARTRDGRAAYFQLKTMIFGQSFKSKIKAQSDHTMEASVVLILLSVDQPILLSSSQATTFSMPITLKRFSCRHKQHRSDKLLKMGNACDSSILSENERYDPL
jgi:hypothetical protein